MEAVKKRGRPSISSGLRESILELGKPRVLTTTQIAHRLNTSRATVRKYLPRKYWPKLTTETAYKRLGRKMCHARLLMESEDETALSEPAVASGTKRSQG
jgi:hypothetical protein